MKNTVRGKELGTVEEIVQIMQAHSLAYDSVYQGRPNFPWTPASCPWTQTKWKLSDNLPSPAHHHGVGSAD